MAIAPNPLTLIYDELWTLLEASTELTDLVKVGNRIKFNSETNRDPLKENVASEDMPELLIISDGADINLMNSSSTSKIDLSYSIVLNTGDYRLNVFTHQLQWFILCQFSQWRSTLTGLQWCDKSFVKVVRLQNMATGQSVAERNRGINGFTTVVKVLIEVILNTAHIVAVEP